MRITARSLLCANAFRVHADMSGGLFEELGQLCAAAAEKRWLAIGMVGLLGQHMMHGQVREASRLASEHMALIESIGDPTLMVGLSFAAIYAKDQSAEYSDVLRWSQAVIDLADGDPARGNFIIGSPLALAFRDAGACPVLAGSSRMARGPAPRPGHGPQRRPHVLRHGRHLRLRRGNTVWRAQARRFRDAGDRGCPTGCRTIR
jgi:hypothetical protein